MSQKKNLIQDQITDLLDQLSYTQQRFVIARLECDTDIEAAEKIGISRETVSRWPEREIIRKVITLSAVDALAGARAIIQRNAIKAAMVKVKGMDSKDERIAQQAAKEVLEWSIDMPVQPVELWREAAIEAGLNPDAILEKAERVVSEYVDSIDSQRSDSGGVAAQTDAAPGAA